MHDKKSFSKTSRDQKNENSNVNIESTNEKKSSGIHIGQSKKETKKGSSTEVGGVNSLDDTYWIRRREEINYNVRKCKKQWGKIKSL